MNWDYAASTSIQPCSASLCTMNARHSLVYEMASKLGIPVTFQMGLNWAPGAIVDAKPLDLRGSGRNIPDLSSWPIVHGYIVEALALAIKYRNVYLDTAILFSGRPESSVASVYVGDYGLDVVEASLRDRIVFASTTKSRSEAVVARAVRGLGLRPLTERKVMGENAEAILNRKA
jgi:predicted TIM-barrel fold metal-dependent hydrolase